MSPKNLIAVNTYSYGSYQDGAYAHLEKMGIRHVEIGAPMPDDIHEVARRLSDFGLTASTMQCPCDLKAEAETIRPRLEAGRAMGAGIFFVSVKAGESMSKPDAYRRLRERAELADEYGITLAMETHPDLGENANEAQATIHAVNHPRLRWNLDTANLYYYNANIDAVEQARQGGSLIGAVHLKETNGAQRCWWFPALGDGVVDFAGVFTELAAVGFHGPFTLELEGVEGKQLDEGGAQEQVASSLRYLREIGVMD